MNEIENRLRMFTTTISDAEKKLGRSSAKTIAFLKKKNSPTHSREASCLIVDNARKDLPGMQINRATADDKVGSVYGFQDPA
jgi:hypothetical protein